MAGVGKRATCHVAGHRFAWQAQGIVRGSANRCVVLCEKSAACVCVDVVGVAKAWQGQGIRGFVDLSLERTLRRTQWQADATGALLVHDGVQCEAQWEAANTSAPGARVGRCGIGDARVSLNA